MEISNQTNNYQTLNSYQQPPVTTLPTEPINPIEPPEKELSPEEKLNQDREAQAALDAQTAETEAKQQAQIDYAAGYVAHQSKQTQVEIYLSVATDSQVSLDNNTIGAIETLRDIEKQNNAVAAYATYRENQQNGGVALF